jgi:hypothetical protein
MTLWRPASAAPLPNRATEVVKVRKEIVDEKGLVRTETT